MSLKSLIQIIIIFIIIIILSGVYYNYFANNKKISLIGMSRRWGQNACLMAGLENSNGKTCVTIDVDLQDPPELIAKMYNEYTRGYEVILMQRKSRKGETFIRMLITRIGYWLINKLSDVEIKPNVGDFRLLSRKFINKLIDLKESHINWPKIHAKSIYHFAANADVRGGLVNHDIDLNKNLLVTKNCCDYAYKNKISQFNFASSATVYGEPDVFPTGEDYISNQTSLYGASKISCEAFIQAYSNYGYFKSTIFRFVSWIGKGYSHGVIYDFVNKLLKDSKKLEILGDKRTLLPEMIETLKSTETLSKEGFKVMVYCNDDPLMAKRLENSGAVAVMPLAAPIGSGLGIQNKVNIQIIKQKIKIPLLIDAGIGQASDATIAMELGCDGVLVNTAIAKAKNPVEMANAMKLAVISGRKSYLSGRIKKSLLGNASSPQTGII